ncbi:hypothetical protein C8A01DRAFT_13272 [Parachaetomium inaequale]|uniref:Uncharacterized protein n=1 Tax=Parachaetomium inaequale TaxID=2588326 RepID=A0AAN6PLY5_9PEZI|nr:hypothetical protein C8A01DRAFT_13272 [Parachaetomium inaequale]
MTWTPDVERPQPLLRLSCHLRHRILLHTGIARFDGRPYTYHLDGRKESRTFECPELDPPPTSNFAGLLLSCRALYAEAAALLYSANRFIIFYSTQRSLKPLRALSPTSLAFLTSLKIVLNESSCHQPVDSVNYPPGCCWDSVELELPASRDRCAKHHSSIHHRPLLDSAPGSDSSSAKLAAQAMLGEWGDTAAYLSSYIGVGRRLTLSLEVTWSRQERRYQVCRPPCDYPCPPSIHHGCQLSRCRSSEFAYEPGSALALGCFCRRRHAAFSFACRCWAPPTDLFLICRALYRDAQFVFFSGNRFIVHDFHASRPWDLPAVQQPEPQSPDAESAASTTRHYPYERFAASEFLRDMVPARCLAHLCFLELVFPPYMPYGWPQDGCAALRDWRATVEWVRGEVNAPALTLRLVMADSVYLLNGRRAVAEDQGADILEAYTRIIDPLRSLVRDDGLAGFYVQAAYPWRWNLDTVRNIQWYGEEWLVDVEQALKEHFERRIRGRGASLGSRKKPEPSKSAWQRWYKPDDY